MDGVVREVNAGVLGKWLELLSVNDGRVNAGKSKVSKCSRYGN